MAHNALASFAALLILIPFGNTRADRILDQITVGRPADTAVIGVEDYLLPTRSDSVIFKSNARDLLPLAEQDDSVTSLFRASPTGVISPIRIPAGAKRYVRLQGADPTGRWLAVVSNCRLDRPNIEGCSTLQQDNSALYLLDTQSGEVTLITHRPDQPDEIARGHFFNEQIGDTWISTNGRYVYFVFGGNGLLPDVGHMSFEPLTYRFDRSTRQIQRVGRIEGIHADQYRSKILWASDDGTSALIGQGPGLVRFSDDEGGDVPVVEDFDRWEFATTSGNGEHLVLCDTFFDESQPSWMLQYFQFTRVSVADGSRVVVNPAPSGLRNGTFCHAKISNDGNTIFGPEWHTGSRFGTYQAVRWNVAERQRTLLTPKFGAPNTAANGESYVTDISTDGSTALIQSFATDLLPAEAGHEFGALFLHRSDLPGLTLVSQDPMRPGRAFPAGGQIAASGQWIHVKSPEAPTMIRDDNDAYDLFAYRVADGTMSLTTRHRSEQPSAANQRSGKVQVSEDGRFVAFNSMASNLIEGMTMPAESLQVLVASTNDRSTKLVSGAPGLPLRGADGESYVIGISGDGSKIAFSSTSTALHLPAGPVAATPKGIDPPKETFVWHRDTGARTLVTRSVSSPTIGPNSGYSIAFDHAGTHVLHGTGNPSALFAGFVDPPGFDPFRNALLRLPVAADQPVELVTHAFDQPNMGPNASVEYLGHSEDLQQVAFSSRASNLLAAPLTTELDQIYIADRSRARMHWLTRSAANSAIPADAGAFRLPVSVSRNGRYAVFSHSAHDLVLPTESGEYTVDCFRFSLETNAVIRVSERPHNAERSFHCDAISDDGRFVMYTEYGSDNQGQTGQVWVADINENTRVLVSPLTSEIDGRSVSIGVALSGRGDQALLQTRLGNPIDSPTFENLFLRNIASGTLETITDGDVPGVDLAGRYQESVSATPDLRTIVFHDGSATLKTNVVGPTNIADVFVSRAARLSDNPGITGLWGEPGVEGQGFHLIGIPGDKRVLLSWYTYLPEGTVATRTKQRWLLGLGDIEDGIARFEVSAADSGLFDMAGAGAQVPLGEVIFRFGDCNRAEVEYAVDLNGRHHAGLIPLTRITPDTACTDFAATGDTAVANLPRPANSRWQYGMNGAWHDPAKPGQGMLIEVMPSTQQVIATWFAFDPGQTLGDGRQPPLWLAAIGPISGDRAQLSVFETAGGTFDRSGGTTLTPIGTLNLDAVSCTRAMATYSVTLGGVARTGQIPLERITPSAHCSP